MPHIGNNLGGSSGNIHYPIGTMREAAQDILNAVQAARHDHNDAWSTIDHYISVTCAPSYKPFGITPQLGWIGNSVSRILPKKGRWRPYRAVTISPTKRRKVFDERTVYVYDTRIY